MKLNISYLRSLIVGVEAPVPLKNGTFVKGINFDNAASTPPFLSVMQAINNFAPWYSSVHRGTGFKSQISSEIYDNARKTVTKFVNSDPRESCVIFLKNTTEAINKLSYRLLSQKDGKNVIITTSMEHHSNDLPWRNKYRVEYTAVDKQGRLILDNLEAKLKKNRGRVKLVTVTGASNVTGYLNPIYDIAALAHKYGAKILVDGAQFVPHSPINMRPEKSCHNIDYLAFSAHKMYAPFGAGVLIGPQKDFCKGAPEYQGGGTVDIVTHDFVKWAEPPFREEAGSPNVIGTVALVEAIKVLKFIGMENIEANEKLLTDYALEKLRKIPDIILYGNTKDSSDRVGIITFNIPGIYHQVTARILSEEAGIAVRNGCFCAQPYIQGLLNVSSREMLKYAENPELERPGMVRVSLGLYNEFSEVDRLIEILQRIAENKSYYQKKYNNTIPCIARSFA